MLGQRDRTRQKRLAAILAKCFKAGRIKECVHHDDSRFAELYFDIDDPSGVSEVWFRSPSFSEVEMARDKLDFGVQELAAGSDMLWACVESMSYPDYVSTSSADDKSLAEKGTHQECLRRAIDDGRIKWATMRMFDGSHWAQVFYPERGDEFTFDLAAARKLAALRAAERAMANSPDILKGKPKKSLKERTDTL